MNSGKRELNTEKIQEMLKKKKQTNKTRKGGLIFLPYGLCLEHRNTSSVVKRPLYGEKAPGKTISKKK